LNNYEALFLIKADLEKEEQDKLVESIHEEITKRNGQLKGTQDLYKRPLAYEINKYREGLYYLVNFDALSDIINSLRDAYKLNDSILRSLILKRG